MVKDKKLVILGVLLCAVIAGLSFAHAQGGAKGFDVDTNAYEPPPQGTIIPCEICVVLYPEHYKNDPKKCPLCHGAKEHFQPAQMMTREMAQMQLHQLDLEIQEFLYKTVLDSLANPVKPDELKKLRKLYMRKLIHVLVYDFLDVEPVKEKILQLDETIELRKKSN